MNLKKIISRMKHNPLKGSVKDKGIALILAVTSLLFMVYIAKEVSRDSLTEYVVNSHELNRLKAYYAARNGMDIALLRIKIFQQASRFPLPPAFAQEIDQIWKFPFAWPLPAPPEMNSVDRENMDKMMKESFMDATYTHTIEDEGSKIDVNDLISPSKTLREITKKQLLTIFERKVESDETFRQEYQNFRFDDLVNRIIDFMSEVNESAGGGGKQGFFTELGQGYPPNRGFRTLDEIRLIPGMSEEFFNILKDQITIYGMKSINPNTASENVLKSLDKGMTDEAVKEAIARRNDPELGGPFVGSKPEECLADFKKFVESRGARLEPEFDQIPMLCDKVINFRIRSTGIYGAGAHAIMKDITAIVVDLNKSAAQIKTFIDKEKEAANPNQNPNQPPGGSGPKSPPAAQTPLPKGSPRVVYWSEN